MITDEQARKRYWRIDAMLMNAMLWRLMVVACFVGLGLMIYAKLPYTFHYPVKKGDARTYIDRGKAKAGRGEYFEAISDYDMAISLNPADAKSYYYRGEAKDKLGQYSAAIFDYNAAIRGDPNAAYVYNSRGWAKFRLGQHAAAIVDYNTISDRHFLMNWFIISV